MDNCPYCKSPRIGWLRGVKIYTCGSEYLKGSSTISRSDNCPVLEGSLSQYEMLPDYSQIKPKRKPKFLTDKQWRKYG